MQGFLTTASGVGNAVVGACDATAAVATAKNSTSAAAAPAAQASAKVLYHTSTRYPDNLIRTDLLTGGSVEGRSKRMSHILSHATGLLANPTPGRRCSEISGCSGMVPNSIL
jgi:hypothetical protein